MTVSMKRIFVALPLCPVAPRSLKMEKEDIGEAIRERASKKEGLV